MPPLAPPHTSYQRSCNRPHCIQSLSIQHSSPHALSIKHQAFPQVRFLHRVHTCAVTRFCRQARRRGQRLCSGGGGRRRRGRGRRKRRKGSIQSANAVINRLCPLSLCLFLSISLSRFVSLSLSLSSLPPSPCLFLRERFSS